ncbi:MAG: sugar phosphate isomerase/epimerase family protein [Planctomycetota bacterium]
MTRVVGTQMYPWFQYREREGRSLSETLAEAFEEALEARLTAWEHSAETADAAVAVKRLADQHGLAMPSLYTGSQLHDTETLDAELQRIDGLAEACAGVGIDLLVTNPNPISWSTEEDKSDAQLRTQARALGELVARCGAYGVTLAYHVHAPEFRAGAREFHHMMRAVPELKLCLDTHWLFQGCGYSNVALLDLMACYGDRTVSLHLRQSRGHVWTQTLGDGDLDYGPVFEQLDAIGFAGPVFLECAIEDRTDLPLGVVDAHRVSAEWVRARFV